MNLTNQLLLPLKSSNKDLLQTRISNRSRCDCPEFSPKNTVIRYYREY